MKHPLCLLFAALLFTHARGDEPVVRKDIPYEGARRSGIKADLYTPPGNHAAPLPAVLYIHGGGWYSGDKGDQRGQSVCRDLVNAGYAVFAINYQLGNPGVGQAGWPQNFYDCKTALRYMRKNAAELGIDPARIGVIGLSAGGHLALLLGSTAQVKDLNQGGLYTEQGNDVSCIIDFYGPPDLAAFEQTRATPLVVPIFKGATDAETAENIRRASPVTYIDAKTPPILVIQGAADTLVPVQLSRNFADRLKQLGTTYQYVEIPGLNHGFSMEAKQTDPVTRQTKETDLRPVAIDFLKKYLGDPKPGQ